MEAGGQHHHPTSINNCIEREGKKRRSVLPLPTLLLYCLGDVDHLHLPVSTTPDQENQIHLPVSLILNCSVQGEALPPAGVYAPQSQNLYTTIKPFPLYHNCIVQYLNSPALGPSVVSGLHGADDWERVDVGWLLGTSVFCPA